ncbi:hypothetical protein [Marinomonas sp. 2405UD68-3]|uniref:hypothetical protein n=1 Tax=Marinomonas sp. 2405UD68-3 TaxID=3391835 RepID=UPI0039C93D16
MLVHKALDKELLFLLDCLESSIFFYESRPQKNIANIKAVFFKLYTIIEENSSINSSVTDFLLSNKRFILGIISKSIGFNEKLNCFLFEVLDVFKQAIFLKCFIKDEFDYDMDFQYESIEKLKSLLLSLKENGDPPFFFFKYKAIFKNKSPDFIIFLVESFSESLDVVGFYIDGNMRDDLIFYDSSYIFIEVETSCSLLWLQKKYPMLDWEASSVSESDAEIFYNDLQKSMSLYEDFINEKAELKKQFYENIMEKQNLFKNKYTYSLVLILKKFSSISSFQLLDDVYISKHSKKSLEFFLECFLLASGSNKNISLIRLNGKSFFYFSPVSGFNELARNKFIEIDGLIVLTESDNTYEKGIGEFSLEYDALYYDVIVIKRGDDKYIVPKYQIQDVVTYNESLFFNDEYGFSYYRKGGTDILLFDNISWSVSSIARSVNQSDRGDRSHKKIIFIEQAGLIFGLVCEFLSEITFARKLPFRVGFPSVAAFWKTREGELLGEFTPFKKAQCNLDVKNKSLQIDAIKLRDISFIGVFKNDVIAIERSVACSIESISLDCIYQLRSYHESKDKFYLTFKGDVFSILNVGNDFKRKDAERGHFVLFCYPNKKIALYFSSIRYDRSSLYLDGKIARFWDEVNVAESTMQDGNIVYVLLESNFTD